MFLMLCVVISAILSFIASKQSVPHRRSDLSALQAAHVLPAPRFGGFALLGGLVISLLVMYLFKVDIGIYFCFILTALPVFVVGGIEDLGLFSSIAARLFAGILSGLLFVVIFQQMLPRFDVPGLDAMMTIPFFAIAFTVFACLGVTHSFNLIDGLNGLAPLIAIGVSASLATISWQLGLNLHFTGLLLVCAGTFGFLVVNYPLGKIFLGDSGAYLLGHSLSWSAVSLVATSDQVATFSILLIFLWPIADTLLAVMRRVIKRMSVTEPDKLHFHQLVMRSILIMSKGKMSRSVANPLATSCIVPFAFAPMIVGVYLSHDKFLSAVGVIVFSALFLVSYVLLLKITRTGPR